MKRDFWIIVITSLGTLMAVVDVTIVNVALPMMQRDMRIGFTELQWVVNAYTIPLAVFLLTAGKLSDVFGRKRLFVIGMGIFTVGSAVCAAAHVIGHAPFVPLMVGRVIQGSGAAVLVPGSLAIVNEAFHRDEGKRTAAVGGRGAMAGLGLSLGPLLGGALLMRFDWTSIFLVNVPVGIAAVWVTLHFVEESCDRAASRRIDVYGLLTLSCSVLLLVLGLISLEESVHHLTVLTVGYLAGGVLLGAAFVLGELHVKEPLYDLSLFRNRSFSGAAAVVFLLSAAILGMLFFLTLYLQNVLRLSPLDTGLVLLPLTATVLVVSPFAGRAVTSVGARWLATSGMISGTIGIAILTLTPVGMTAPDWIVLMPAFVLIGLGMGLTNPSVVSVATGTVPHEHVGLASGMNYVCRQVGVAFGVALIGTFVALSYDSAVASALPPPRAAAVQRAGTVAGSGALRNPSPQTRALQRRPNFARTSRIAQLDWVRAFHVGLMLAALLLLLATIVSLATLRRSDMLAEKRKRAA